METLAMLGLGPDGVPNHKKGSDMGGREDSSLATFRVHKDAVSGLHLQGDILYSASFDSTVCAVDLHRGVAVNTFYNDMVAVHCVREHAGTVYAGDECGSITASDARTGQTSSTIHAHSQPVLCVFADEKLLYTGSHDCSIRVFDIRTLKCLKKYKVHSGPVTALQVVEGTVFSSSWDGSVFSMPPDSGEGKRRTMGTEAESPSVLEMQVVGTSVYAGYRDGRARAWGASSLDKPTATFIAHDASMTQVLVDEALRMYTASDDATICVWDLKLDKRVCDRDKCLHVYQGHADGILALAKGGVLLYSGSYDHSIKVWDAEEVDASILRTSPPAPPLGGSGEGASSSGAGEGGGTAGPPRKNLPLHLQATAGAGGKQAGHDDPDWWKLPQNLKGGGGLVPRLGVRFEPEVLPPTVAEVLAGSAAAEGGLLAGDMLVTLNDLEVPTLSILGEVLAYLSPGDAADIVVARPEKDGASGKEISLKLTLMDEELREEPFELTALQVFGGCFDIMTQTLPANKQVNGLHDVFEKHAEFFRKVMLKHGEQHGAVMTLRKFWLLAARCHLVTPKMSLAELDRLVVAARMQQLYPHERTRKVASPHDAKVVLSLHDMLFGLARLASVKYSKVPAVPAKLERLIQKHLLPFADSLASDVFVAAAIEESHARALDALLAPFRPPDHPFLSLTADDFIHAIGELKLGESVMPPAFIAACAAKALNLFVRHKDPAAHAAAEADVDRQQEMVGDEVLYAVSLVANRMCGEGATASRDFMAKYVVGFSH